ncbi:MAG TPA: hypothetical protein VMA83_01745 [Solirubrobacteraceae bacterium]|nr:hypothetical protein [Solirubrobacteraceae bacterium]
MERVLNATIGRAARPQHSRALLAAAALLAAIACGALALALRDTGAPVSAARAGAPSPLAEGYGPGYWAVPLAGSALAGSPAQHLSERYSAGGVSLRHDGAVVTLKADALATSRPRTELNRVSYTAPGIKQWFANSPHGVAQSFTVAQPAQAASRTTLDMTVGGNTVATLRHGEVTFSRAGRTQLRYGHLAVRDATGRALPAHLALNGRRLQIVIDTRGASYPLHVDPVFETEEGASIVRIPEAGEGEVGASVSVDANGQTAIVGAPRTSYLPGAAWILYRLAGHWYQFTGFVNPNTRAAGGTCSGSIENELEEAECSFGISVAISDNGKVAAVGSPEADEDRGEVRLYEVSNVGISPKWKQVERIAAPENSKRLTRFGRSVALSEDGSTLAVGAPSDYIARGSAWVFKRPSGGSQWAQVGPRLSGGTGDVGEGRLGRSIAISGNGQTVVVGAPGVAEPGKWHGAAFVYRLDETGEKPEYKLGPGSILSDTSEEGEERFGVSVAISQDGSTILVGARQDDAKSGAAFVFVPGTEGWNQQGEKLQAISRTEGPEGQIEESVESLSQFGYSVALSGNGNEALIGGPTTGKYTGAAWVFTRELSKWTEAERLEPTEVTGKVWFGDAVALSADGNSALVGGEQNENDAGAVWSYMTAGELQAETEAGELPEKEKEREELEQQEREEREKLEEESREEEVRLKEEEEEQKKKEEEEKQKIAGEQSKPKKGVQADVLGVTGTVTIEQPRGSGKFVTLTPPITVKNDSVINAANGVVTLELEGENGKMETVVLHGGEFEIEQTRNGYTFFTLKGGNAKCHKSKGRKVRHGRASAARRRRRPYRRLWVEGHGKFASKGSYASGAVLGTRWETLDSCEGTEIVVITDKVLVTNLRTHKKYVVKAGHHRFIQA